MSDKLKDLESENKCPFCGGYTGYQTEYRVRFAQGFEWDGETAMYAEDITRSKADNWQSKKGVCLDCHKTFKLTKIKTGG